MATKRQIRTRKQTNPSGISDTQREYLLSGYHWGIGEPFENLEAERQAWEAHHEELIDFWISDPEAWKQAGNRDEFLNPEPAGPGHRPWAWWKWGNHRRRRISGPVCEGPWEWGLPQDCDECEHESGLAYLRRKKLLTAGEQAALKRKKG